MGYFDTLAVLSITAGSLFLVLGSLAIELASQRLTLPTIGRFGFKTVVVFDTIELLTVGGLSAISALASDYARFPSTVFLVIGSLLTVFLIVGLGTMAYSVKRLMTVIPDHV